MRSLHDGHCPRPILILAVALSLVSGCSSSPDTDQTDAGDAQDQVARSADGPPVRLAVIDVDEVARQIGAMEKIELSLAKYETELNEHLDEFRKQLTAEYTAKRDEFGDQPEEDQQDELDNLFERHQQSLVTQARLAQSRLQAHGDDLRLRLVNQVRPIAYQIASQRGMSVVLTTAQVYAAPPSADITGDVIDRIRDLNTAAENDSRDADTRQRTARLPDGGAFKPY